MAPSVSDTSRTHDAELGGAASTPTRVVLIRHGESNVTVDRVLGGFRTCSGLSPLGRLQAERLRDRVATTGELASALLIASNFPRAIETAEIIAPAFADSEVLIDAGFGEHDPGPELDGVTFVEYVERLGTPNWGGDPHHEVFPGGETTAQFHLRVGSALSKTVDANVGSLIVIACHGGVVDAIFRQLMKAAPTGLFDLWTTNTSLTEFQLSSKTASHRPRWRLVRYNDAAHLAGLAPATNNSLADNSAADDSANGEPATDDEHG